MKTIRFAVGMAAALLAAQGALAQLDHPAPDPAAPAQSAPKPIRVTPAAPAEAPKAQPRNAAAEKLYNEDADAKADIAAAMARAKRDHSRVLIQWGFETCHWCHLLHDTMKSDKGLAHELLYEYQVVMVDTPGKDKRNMELAASYGATVAKDGFPYLTILDEDGKVVANHETSSLELKDDKGESIIGEGSGHDAAKVLGFLKANEAPRVEAGHAFKSGVAKAQESGKLVFLHFGAPWCGWCHRLEDWMARPEIAGILGKNFVDVKIDQDRMPGAKELMEHYKATGGIPWFAFIDPETGRALATSTNARGENIGFPGEPAEIEHFAGMLKAAAKKLSAEDVRKLEASLRPKSDKPI